MPREMTTKEYAALRGIHEGAVRKAVKMGYNLPGVTANTKFGKAHVFTVSDTFYRKNKK